MHSEKKEFNNLRDKIIGLGDSSIQKSYYPELQKRIQELERFRYLLDETIDIIFLLKDPSGIIIDYNRSTYEQLGYESSDIKKMSLLDIIPDDEYINQKNEFKNLFDGQLGKHINMETYFQRKDGNRFPVELVINKERFGADIYSVILARDITERKEAENRIKSSLEEKNVLLREIHHRVKNNMQVISSLLSLQSRFIKNGDASNIFKDSQNRVKSMSMIHEMLYQSPDLSSIDFNEYIQNLVRYLFHSYGVDNEHIKIHVKVSQIKLEIDRAIPLGLIVNELVSNAIKHAFPKGKGNIYVVMVREKCHYTFIVKDDGVGLPTDFDINQTETLGLELIITLTGQLDGTIEEKRNHGTEFIIDFPCGY
jgi:PAS domain S-box-containing protein